MISSEKAVKGKGKHPNCVAARKKNEFKKGEPVPKGGRPKGSLSLKERLQTFLDIDIKIKMPDGTIQDKSMLDSILLSLISQAQKGNIKAIQEVLDRNFGKEIQKIENVADDELKLTVCEIKESVELLQRNERPY